MCGNPIGKHRFNSFTCGMDCAIKLHTKTAKENDKRYMKKNCIHCGKEFFTMHNKTMLCSGACREEKKRESKKIFYQKEKHKKAIEKKKKEMTVEYVSKLAREAGMTYGQYVAERDS